MRKIDIQNQINPLNLNRITKSPNESNQSNASEFLVSVLDDLLNCENINSKKIIHRCVCDLDKLAQLVDLRLEKASVEKKPFYRRNVKLSENLKIFKIEETLWNLQNKRTRKAFAATFEGAISNSITYNSTLRSRIYDLRAGLALHNNTEYFIPAAFVLNEISSNTVAESQLEELMLFGSTIIQLIDDLIDLIVDLKENSRTPITDYYTELLNENYGAKSALKQVIETVIVMLKKVGFAYEMECEKINKDYDRDLTVKPLNTFISHLENLHEAESLEVLDDIRQYVPPIFCYT